MVIGYVAGAVIGIPGVDPTVVNGDMNGVTAVNPYNDLLVSPENMCFKNRKLSKDPEAIHRTETTLNIIYSQIAEFNSLYRFASLAAKDNEHMSTAMDSLTSAAVDNGDAFSACADALEALHNLQAGKKVNLKEASVAATKAYNAINRQIAGGKTYVETADAFVSKGNLSENMIIATARDMLANLCAVDATLAQNDAEIDYWGNTSNLLPEVNLAQK